MLKSLQAGRAIAALAVLAFHLHGSPLMPAGFWLSSKSNHGNLGVDFFFVLSGFIILFAHEKDIGRPERLGRYIGNRFRRVYPVYWIFTAAFIGSMLIFGGTTPLPNTLGGWTSTISLIRVSPEKNIPLSVAWTLFYEIAFYGLFALLILSRRLGMTVFLIWGLLIIGVHQYAPTHSVFGVWSSLVCINFFIGMAACAAHRLLPGWASILVLSVGIIGLIADGLIIDKNLPIWVCQPAMAVSCGLIICGAASIETHQKIWFGPFVLIGNASYTLYLVHEHISQLTLKVLRRLNVIGAVSPDTIFVATFLVTVAASVGLYLAVEKPLVVLLKRVTRTRATQRAEIIETDRLRA